MDKVATLHQVVHTATWTATTDCRIRLLPARVLRQLLSPRIRDIDRLQLYRLAPGRHSA